MAKYCRICGLENPDKDELITIYEGKEIVCSLEIKDMIKFLEESLEIAKEYANCMEGVA